MHSLLTFRYNHVNTPVLQSAIESFLSVRGHQTYHIGKASIRTGNFQERFGALSLSLNTFLLVTGPNKQFHPQIALH